MPIEWMSINAPLQGSTPPHVGSCSFTNDHDIVHVHSVIAPDLEETILGMCSMSPPTALICSLQFCLDRTKVRAKRVLTSFWTQTQTIHGLELLGLVWLIILPLGSYSSHTWGPCMDGRNMPIDLRSRSPNTLHPPVPTRASASRANLA